MAICSLRLKFVQTPIKNHPIQRNNMIRGILLICLVAFSLNLRGECPTELTGQLVNLPPTFNNIILSLSSIEEGLAVNDVDQVQFNWTDDAGVPIIGSQLVIEYNEFGDGDGCNIDIQVVKLEVICLEDPSVVILEDSIVFTVYPNVVVEGSVTFPPLCETEIETVCGPDLIIEYSVDGGNNYSLTPPDPPGLGDPPVVMDYRIYWEDLPNPNNVQSGTLTIYCEDCPDVSTTGNNTIYCNNGPTLDLQTLQVNPDPSIGNWALIETPNGSNPAQLIGTTFDPAGADIGMYTLGFFNPLPACTDTSFQTIEVAETTSAGEGINGTVCQDSSFVLSLDNYLNGNFEQGTWQETSSPPSTNNAFNSLNRTFDANGQSMGLYTFRHIVSSSCGIDTAFVEINILEQTENIVLPSIAVCNGNLGETTVNFNGLVLDNSLTGTWNNMDNASVDLTSLNAVDFTGVPPGNYAFSFSIGGSCPAISTITVQDCAVEVLVPNAFTPNNDGLNDRFQIVNAASIESQSIKFQIYNRWGQMVFSTTDPTTAWDGTYQNEVQDLGIYMYFIELDNNVIVQGSVTLIR